MYRGEGKKEKKEEIPYVHFFNSKTEKVEARSPLKGVFVVAVVKSAYLVVVGLGAGVGLTMAWKIGDKISIVVINTVRTAAHVLDFVTHLLKGRKRLLSHKLKHVEESLRRRNRRVTGFLIKSLVGLGEGVEHRRDALSALGGQR